MELLRVCGATNLSPRPGFQGSRVTGLRGDEVDAKFLGSFHFHTSETTHFFFQPVDRGYT